jgi:hypothetical protein
MRRLAGAVTLLALAGCALPPAGCSHAQLSRLYLGRDSPQGDVSDPQWEAFVADTLTAQFPAGFTVLDARGQWRGENGAVRRESSRIVEIVHDDETSARQRIAVIAAAYRHRFAQEAVLVAQSPVRRCLDASPAR